MTRSRSAPEVPDAVEPLLADDPATAILDAYAAGATLRLPTSGTTAAPRTVVRSAASWVHSFDHVARLTDLDRDSRAWIPGPLSATMNLFAATLVRHRGARLVGSAGQATHVFLTPAAFGALLAADGPGAGGRTVMAGNRHTLMARDRHAVVAGDRIEPHLAQQAERAGWRVSHYYGAAQLSFVAWGRDAESLRPFPEVEIEIRAGEIWVRSPWVCDDVEPDGLQLLDGWATVRDRGTLAAGRLTVSGRAGVIVTAGATVVVSDVERALRTAASGEVAVVGRPHPDLGAVMVAVSTTSADVPVLRRLARTTLPPSHRPRVWLLTERLPLTDAGKLDRAALAAWAANR